MMVCKEPKLVTIYDVKDFDLTHIFECGQCFRWDKTDDDGYIGIAHERVIKLCIKDGNLLIYNTNDEEYNSIWHNYFDMSCDYTEIKKSFSNDDILKKATEFGGGIRILNQDVWECIISFIISANNNIPRIKGIIGRFCEKFGKPVVFEGKTYFSFPSYSDLAGITVNDLASLKAGFRDKYIVDAVNKLNSGEVSLEAIKNGTIDEARNELIKIKGIGRKVADCVLLFGAGKKSSFPVDVWVKRVLSELYTEETKDKDVFQFALEKFGENAGVAQQYLFYYMRENSKGGK